MFDIDAPDGRPDPWALVVLPTREHFRRFVPFDGVGGIYDHDRRTLATRDLGPSLRHEFVHVLHHRRMARLGQRHAFWLQEGLASLVERVERQSADAAEIRPVANWRMNIARRLAEPHRLTPWERLFSLEPARFMTERPLAMYAQSYAAIFMLLERGELRAWLASYERGFADDPTGIDAFVETLGVGPAQSHRRFRDWLVAKPPVAEAFSRGDASLGAVLAESEAEEGPRVSALFARMTGPGANPLRPRTSCSIEASPGQTLERCRLSRRAVGDRVRSRSARPADLEVDVELVAYDERRARRRRRLCDP